VLPPGTKAPSFALKDWLSDKPLVLVFFKVGCPTCQFTMPFVQRIADGAAGKATFLAVSQDDESATREFYETYGLTLPVLLDTKKEHYAGANAYRIEFVPTFFMISPEGMITQSFTGFVKSDLDELGKQFGVETFRKGEKVPALKPG
jgi:peroxiredoxin